MRNMVSKSKYKKMDVVKFYTGKNILITGGLGFMGKALVEKLLRSSPKINNIYLLVRDKDGSDAQSRLSKALQSKIFDRIRDSGALSKIVLVKGELAEPNLGLTKSNEELLVNQVNVVFHNAASINLKAKLNQTFPNNTLGTKSILELCSKMRKLEMTVYISTAYSNTTFKNSLTKEQVYPSPVDLNELLKSFNDAEFMNSIHTSNVPSRYANGYVMSKALSENIIEQFSHQLPLAIIRPSIVTGAWKDPFPGWADDVSQISHTTISIGKGYLRFMEGDETINFNLIPLDIVIDSSIVAACRAVEMRKNGIELPVFNCIHSSSRRLTIQQYADLCSKYWRMSPPLYTSLYPEAKALKSAICFWLSYIIVLIVNILRRLRGKPTNVLYRHLQINKTLKYVKWVTCFEHKFHVDNQISLHTLLSEEERDIFNTDTNIDWEDYMSTYVKGLRRYLLKEDEKTIPQAKINLNRIWWETRICQGIAITSITLLPLYLYNMCG